LQKDPDRVEIKYVYMIRVFSNQLKSKFYGLNNIIYTGQTNHIGIRMNQHLYGINSKFLKKNFDNFSKNLIYVEYVYGNEYDAMGREIEIKRYSKKKKEELIKNKSNALIKYVPCKAIILKKYNCDAEQVCIRIN